MREITIIGGGLGGLVAAIACAEQGGKVTLHGPHWTWLAERGVVSPLGRPPARALMRCATARGRTGALDLPGSTWRDRPAIERGDGVFLGGDMVAAPGMRGEITINSAIRAAQAAMNA